MYLIVLFEEDNKTGPVAKEWFSDGLAWWPPYRDKCQILRTVQKKVVPNPSRAGDNLLHVCSTNQVIFIVETCI